MSSIIDEADDDNSSVIIISEHQVVGDCSKQKVFKVSEIECSPSKKDEENSTQTI